MDSSLIPSTSSMSKSSFWSTKDGKFGVGIAVIVAGLGLWGLYLVLPFLISLATNLLTFGLLCLALFVLIYIVLDKDVRTFTFYLYKTLVKALRRLLVNTDPVGIIKVYIDHLRKQFDLLEEKIRELSGARKKLEDSIARTQEDLENQLAKAKAAQKQRLSPAEIAIYTNQAGRDTDSIKKFQTLLSKLTLLNNLLNDMRKACKVIILDKENQVKSIEQERDAMNVGFSAFKSAVSILKGDPDKRYYFDESMEAIQNDISMKSGIIEQYVQETSEILQSVNLQNAAFEEKGMALLEKWQKEGMPALLTDGSEKIGNTIPASVQYEMVPAGNASDNKYSNILKS
jgi:hypothetical protein